MKRVTIVIILVEECNDVSNSEIEEEIKGELSRNLSVIPWAKKIRNIYVE